MIKRNEVLSSYFSIFSIIRSTIWEPLKTAGIIQLIRNDKYYHYCNGVTMRINTSTNWSIYQILSMKILSLIITLNFFLCISATSQIQGNFAKYSAAYEYIAKDTLILRKKINVSNNLISTCYLCFFDELCKNNPNKELLYKHLDQLDKINFVQKGSIYYCFDSVFVRHINAHAILSFSKIIDNSLFAEVQIGDFGDKSFGEHVYYYFIFESNSTIKRVYRKKMYGLW